MLQPQLRSLLATATLTSVLALIPASRLTAQPRPRPDSSSRQIAERIAPLPTLWSFLLELLPKQSVRIDPNGQPAQTSAPAPDDPSGGKTLLPGGF